MRLIGITGGVLASRYGVLACGEDHPVIFEEGVEVKV